MTSSSSQFQRFADGERLAFYKAALIGLRYIEQRKATGRRFGPDADARWRSLRGDLATADRIDLLLRDANAEWPGAFSARGTFNIPSVPEDEPFGAGWQPLEPVSAEELWHELQAEPPPASLPEVLDAYASCWRLHLAPLEVSTPQPNDHYLVAGPSAVAGLIQAFAEAEDLNWGEQTATVAGPPGHRQLALMAPALLNMPRSAVVITHDTAEGDHSGSPLASEDAHSADAQWVQDQGD